MKVDILNNIYYNYIKIPYSNNILLNNFFYNSNENNDPSLFILYLINVYKVIYNIIITKNKVKLIII